jgi:hypothetical protein
MFPEGDVDAKELIERRTASPDRLMRMVEHEVIDAG